MLVAAAVGACATAPGPEPTPRRIDRDLARFLPDPSPLAASSAEADLVRELHGRLLAGGDPATLRLEAKRPGAPAGPATRLLAAEADLVAGLPERALDELAALPPAASRAVQSRVVAGRAEEMRGDVVAAVLHYQAAAGSSSVAAAKVRELELEALATLESRIDEELSAGRLEHARDDLLTLEEWRPGEPSTLRRVARYGALAGDADRELAARRALAAGGEESFADQLRRGSLEVQFGDAAGGLALLESLAATHPDDASAQAAWRAARFRFRLVNSPEAVRVAASATELTRADFARLLYWLVSEVRAARSFTPRIATDVLDHPARDEIVRVVNLGLMTLEPSLRQFEPSRPVTRLEAFRALLQIAEVGSGDAGRRLDRTSDLCARAAEAGWASEAAECLPAAPVSGREATSWIRRVVEPDLPGDAE